MKPFFTFVNSYLINFWLLHFKYQSVKLMCNILHLIDFKKILFTRLI